MRTKKSTYLFEVSWEVCNKVGGIHTVLSTKANTILPIFGNKLILLGPDIQGGDNKEFIEDLTLFVDLKEKLSDKGIKIRAGRWDIAGKPLVILIDFTAYFDQKDQIFADLWESYKLDSIHGSWDYVEPTIFGYVAGIVIENFTANYVPFKEKIVAQFHEWMTGAGILYLKQHAPFIATVFTSHATVLGRSLAGNNNPLYQELENYNPSEVANRYNLVAKHSLELTAAKRADSFTTVSNITKKECTKFLGKTPDCVTTNGFSKDLVPADKDLCQKRDKARAKILKTISALIGKRIGKNAKIILTSGRYEYLNKGIDIYLKALSRLQDSDYEGEIIALLCIPLYNVWPRKDLLERVKSGVFEKMENPFQTHYFHHDGNDPILNYLQNSNLTNSNKIYPVFVPCYLDAADGIFNLHYYDFLVGVDATCFVSKYEPWGYTPQEAIAMGVPTITSNLAGYGTWKSEGFAQNNSCYVVDRFLKNDDEVVADVAKQIEKFFSLGTTEIGQVAQDAKTLCQNSLWDKFINNYFEAYDIALSKTKNTIRRGAIETTDGSVERSNKVNWKVLNVKSITPSRFDFLKKLSQNCWCSWNNSAKAVFEYIDAEFYTSFDSNPVKLLNSLGSGRYTALAKDKEFCSLLAKCEKEFNSYMQKPSKNNFQVAYFCMEYGITNYIRLYSGGLGILAGDYLKQASDSGLDLVAVGLLYRFGYFKQSINMENRQYSVNQPQNFNDLPIATVQFGGKDMVIIVKLPGRNVAAKVWQMEVGRVKLYLLDTDISQNSPSDRRLTENLYGGDNEHRLKQEILLGFGGIKVLKKLNIKPDIYHCNEGHAAFINLKRISDLVTGFHLTFDESLEYVRASSLFTTHTPVAAGHDAFDEFLLRSYFRYMPEKLGISWKKFMSIGRFAEKDKNENYSMSALAANTSSEINGVSELHCSVSKSIFEKLYPGYLESESHIGFVTNGVHLKTWTCNQMQEFLSKTCGEKLFSNQTNSTLWEKIYDVADSELWDIRLQQKKNLIHYIKTRFIQSWMDRYDSPEKLLKIVNRIDPKSLTIGFARRFATYKRAGLLFNNPDRLDKIVNNPQSPVQFIFAGKAHPNDIQAQDLMAKIIGYSKEPRFVGKILFLEDYNMELAKMLVSGVDIWLNTPTRPLEASGTSGQKALLNGVINFSVLDGWWCEGYVKGAGFAISQEKSYSQQYLQDMYDATQIYNILEKQIVPMYYNKNADNIPTQWVDLIKNSFAKIAPYFTTARMLKDYIQKFYNNLAKRKKFFEANDYEKCIELSFWKNRVLNGWSSIELVESFGFGDDEGDFFIGKKVCPSIVLRVDELSTNDFGVELVVMEKTSSGAKLVAVKQMDLGKKEANLYSFETSFQLTKPGAFSTAARLYPKHPYLAHRQSFNYVKWF